MTEEAKILAAAHMLMTSSPNECNGSEVPHEFERRGDGIACWYCNFSLDRAQIEKLRSEAGTAGDSGMIDLCAQVLESL